MGRHSAPRTPAPQLTPSLPAGPRHARPPAPRARAAKPRTATSSLWRRSPVIPAAVAVLAVWTGTDVTHLLTAGRPAQAGTITRAAGAEVGVDLSALAGAGSPEGTQPGPQRVSRQSRTLPLIGLVAGTPSTLPARPQLPLVQPGKTVAGDWVRPSAGGESSCFCERWGAMHDGIDLAGPLGSPILAVGDGVVVEAGPAEGFGLWVVIRHANGDFSVYGHMYYYFVTVGEHVRAGQHIADIGANGQSTGPHLHFSVSHHSPTGPYIDPVPWLKERGVEVGPYNPDA